MITKRENINTEIRYPKCEANTVIVIEGNIQLNNNVLDTFVALSNILKK